jgi:hypothetical protein
VTSQREIESAVREQVAAGALDGSEVLEVETTVSVRGLPAPIRVSGTISLG